MPPPAVPTGLPGPPVLLGQQLQRADNAPPVAHVGFPAPVQMGQQFQQAPTMGVPEAESEEPSQERYFSPSSNRIFELHPLPLKMESKVGEVQKICGMITMEGTMVPLASGQIVSLGEEGMREEPERNIPEISPWQIFQENFARWGAKIQTMEQNFRHLVQMANLHQREEFGPLVQAVQTNFQEISVMRQETGEFLDALNQRVNHQNSHTE